MSIPPNTAPLIAPPQEPGPWPPSPPSGRHRLAEAAMPNAGGPSSPMNLRAVRSERSEGEAWTPGSTGDSFR